MFAATAAGGGFSMATDAQTIARELALGLLLKQWEPRHLNPSRTGSSEILIQHCLEEAIAVREANQPDLSLELLQAAAEKGLESPWLLDNQARALVNLGERQVAWELWQRLLDHDETAVAQTAREMTDLLESTLLQSLGSICTQAGWVPRHLQASVEKPVLERVLLEIIEARQQNAARLSLDMIAKVLDQGWRNPWLLHHRAHALVELQQLGEALEIWHALKDHPHAGLAGAALERAELYQGKLEQQQLLERCASLVRDGDREQAQALLLDALIRTPDADPLRDQLGQLLPRAADALDDANLRQNEIQLAIHEHLLDVLEQKMIQAHQR